MTHRASALISAQEWFSAGERVGYDAERPGINPRSPLRAFIRRAAGTGVTRTFLPGWPDGSYGWAKVEAFLSSRFKLRLARERLADSVEITELAGGHLTTAEQPDRLAEVIAALPERS